MTHFRSGLLGLSALTLIALTLIAPTTRAVADPEDPAWIKRCIADNKNEGQTPATLTTYCSCMVEKMPSATTDSVSTWEKSHATEQEACSTAAKWQSK